jgi:hypothetical protein
MAVQSDVVGTIFLNQLHRRNALSLEFSGGRLPEPSALHQGKRA